MRTAFFFTSPALAGGERSEAEGGPSQTQSLRQAPLPQIQLLEEIIALVVDHDEGREIFYLDAPDRLHAEFGKFLHLHLLDAMLGEVRRRTPDRGEVEAAVLFARLAHGRRA